MLGPEDAKRHRTDIVLASGILPSHENMDKLIRNQPQRKCSYGGMGAGHCGGTSERNLCTTLSKETNKLFHYA